MPESRSPGKLVTNPASPTRSAGMTPSRRSPSSTMSTIPWVRRCSTAARESSSMTTDSVLKLVSELATT